LDSKTGWETFTNWTYNENLFTVCHIFWPNYANLKEKILFFPINIPNLWLNLYTSQCLTWTIIIHETVPKYNSKWLGRITNICL
jgi:hypothetical protein